MFSNLDLLSSIEKHTYQVGLIAQVWALVEASLDVAAYMAFHEHDGNKIVNEVPRGLKPKLAFLRKALKESPRATLFLTDALSILGAAASGKQFRHDCVHGITIQDQGQPPSLHVLDRAPESIVDRVRNVTDA